MLSRLLSFVNMHGHDFQSFHTCVYTTMNVHNQQPKSYQDNKTISFQSKWRISVWRYPSLISRVTWLQRQTRSVAFFWDIVVDNGRLSDFIQGKIRLVEFLFYGCHSAIERRSSTVTVSFPIAYNKYLGQFIKSVICKNYVNIHLFEYKTSRGFFRNS